MQFVGYEKFGSGSLQKTRMIWIYFGLVPLRGSAGWTGVESLPNVSPGSLTKPQYVKRLCILIATLSNSEFWRACER
jgi:hypothetical protein